MTITEENGQLQKLTTLLPQMSPGEQHLSINLYRLLMEGTPVSKSQLARTAKLAADEVASILDSWPGLHFDADGRIVGYWGLSLTPTLHQINFPERQLYAWCAWDTLFLPEVIGEPASVRSNCPVTSTPITMRVSATGVENLDPPTAIVSFVLPPESEINADIVNSFCHYVHFFADERVAARWARQHDGAFIVSVEDAFRAARAKNQWQYRLGLEQCNRSSHVN
jgi:alkylmercury lyase